MNKLVLLIGASGCGKTTLGNHLKTLGVPELISHTTRSIREGEIDGVTYHYVTKKEFDKIDKLERTYYAGNYYCLSKDEVNSHKEDLVYCIVDFNGVEQIRENYGAENVIVIYIDVSYGQMEERMRERGDSEEKIKERLNYTFETGEKLKDILLADYSIPPVSLNRAKVLLEFLIDNIKKEMANEEKNIL
jgi:guanylate kinase